MHFLYTYYKYLHVVEHEHLMLISCQRTYHLSFNPNWHELRKQEKRSSLMAPKSKFYKTQWAWQGVKLTGLMSIFTSKKSWKIFDKNWGDKIQSQNSRGVKVSCLIPIGVNAVRSPLYTYDYPEPLLDFQIWGSWY